MTATHPSLPISVHNQGRAPLGPRLQKLHRVIGAAHREAEGMVFSRSLLQGEATPLQLACLVRALLPIYTALETAGASLPEGLRPSGIPWADLSRHQTLEQDVAAHADGVAHHPELAELDALVETVVTSLATLAQESPARFLAHVYVRYGGDLSGGQQLAVQANQILARAGLPPVNFWNFPRPIAELKQELHNGIEQLELNDAEEAALLEEAPAGFRLNQKLLRALADLAPTPATA